MTGCDENRREQKDMLATQNMIADGSKYTLKELKVIDKAQKMDDTKSLSLSLLRKLEKNGDIQHMPLFKNRYSSPVGISSERSQVIQKSINDYPWLVGSWKYHKSGYGTYTLNVRADGYYEAWTINGYYGDGYIQFNNDNSFLAGWRFYIDEYNYNIRDDDAIYYKSN